MCAPIEKPGFIGTEVRVYLQVMLELNYIFFGVLRQCAAGVMLHVVCGGGIR